MLGAGGYGTLEELLEVITWAQLGIHDKPVINAFLLHSFSFDYFDEDTLFVSLSQVEVGLLNVEGYYNSLLSFIDQAVEEGFISPSARHIVVSAPTVKELVKMLEVESGKRRTRRTQVEPHFAD
ncbi:hypothetical protein BHM03_00001208 [Ensete ventricosum]|uniref:cytokinin riboside 5'-monophosphate phosphoribohydrolase n=1 Tax=Ensete ventricosum TaxID=4639 RepID=A0A445M909_ENSVE|nr:hypothetical protein BHM03_00001208 [Ensete ventricosum]